MGSIKILFKKLDPAKAIRPILSPLRFVVRSRKANFERSVELTFPLGLPEEFGLRGAVFSDFGTAFGADGNQSLINDSMELRASSGAGLAWRSPLGPVRLDLAYPWLKSSFDKTQFFSFSFGTRF